MVPLWLAWGALEAWPCAGIAHQEGLTAESDGAEVLFEPDGDTITASYNVTFQGDAPDLGWVIPVPGEVLSVEDGDPVRFDALREITQPYVQYLDEEGGRGCSACIVQSYGADAGGKANRASTDDLTVIASGFTGTYDYQVVASDDATALQAWFEDNGWESLPADGLEHYVSGGWSFVALRVVPDPAEPLADRALPPVSIAYGGGQMAFPAVMARHAVVEAQRTTIYVVGETRAALQGDWRSEDTEILYGGPDADPTALWEEHLAALGGDRAYVRTFAGPGEGGFLTRFDTLAPREVHDADVVLALEDSVQRHSTEILLGEGVPPGAALLWLPLAGLGVLRRRRRVG